ncbi:ATP-binding protein [Actinosynnema sp. CA-248983]
MSRADHTLERDRELGRIAAALDSATRGEGRIVVVEGAAGIGKTQPVRDCRARFRAACRHQRPPRTGPRPVVAFCAMMG